MTRTIKVEALIAQLETAVADLVDRLNSEVELNKALQKQIAEKKETTVERLTTALYDNALLLGRDVAVYSEKEDQIIVRGRLVAYENFDRRLATIMHYETKNGCVFAVATTKGDLIPVMLNAKIKLT